MNTRRITLLVAAVLALGTGYLTLSYLNSMRAHAPVAQVELRSIVVADHDIPARATVTAAMLRRTQRAADQVEPDAIDDDRRAVGSLALIAIPAGATITASKIGRPVDIGLTPRLKPGMRAISIAIDKVKGVSGLIEPGDRVDVISIPPRNHEAPQAFTILRGVIVLALGSTLETPGATPPPDSGSLTTITLGVTPDQANLLTMADTATTLRLALRPPSEPVRSLQPQNLVFETPANPAPAAPAAPARPAVAPLAPAPVRSVVARRPGVTVIDGDTVLGDGDAVARR